MSLSVRWRAWFFRNTSPEPSPIVLDRRRIYILPTRTGLLYGIVLITMYLGAINYSLGLGHALVFLLVGIGLTGMIHTYRNLAGIGISPGRSDAVFVGDIIHYRLRLHSLQIDPRFAIRISSADIGRLQKNGDNAACFVERLNNNDLVIELCLTARSRGRQTLGRLRIRSRFPLGLFEAWSNPFPNASCLVYPSPVFLPLPDSVPNQQPGQDPGTDGEEDFSGFRLRHPGDSPRHIAWKAYARHPDHQPLLVKTFAGGAQSELWLDWNLTRSHSDTEERLSILCGWVLQAHKEALRFGLRLPGETIPMASGQAHLDNCLERLALFPTPAPSCP